MKTTIVFLLTLAAGRVFAAPVVVELFTSQGCSSCPDADKMLSTWGVTHFKKGDVVPLSYDVDYWNYLGWKDVFSTPEWSRRQEDYARALGARAYTPQMVVAGRDAFVGSDLEALELSVARRAKEHSDAALALAVGKAAGTFVVSGRVLRPWAGRRRVWLAVFENGHATDVGAGENSGRKLANDFVVRALIPVGELEGVEGVSWRKPAAPPLSPGWDASRTGAAVFLQDDATLEISAAASLYPLGR